MCSVITTPMAVVIISPPWGRTEVHPFSRLCARSDLSLIPMQAAKPVERRRLVALGQGWIVEHRVHEVVHRATQRHHRLPDVHQFAGAFADNVHPQYLACIAVEDELE